MNGMGHYLDHVSLTAGKSRRKRAGWRGPVLALLAVAALAVRAML